MSFELVNLSPILRALERATSVPEVKEIRDKAEAVLRYVKQQKESGKIQLQAGLLKIRAEQRWESYWQKSESTAAIENQVRPHRT